MTPDPSPAGAGIAESTSCGAERSDINATVRLEYRGTERAGWRKVRARGHWRARAGEGLYRARERERHGLAE